MTSAEIAFAIFIAKHNPPMAVSDEYGLLAKKMWCTIVPVAPPGGGKYYIAQPADGRWRRVRFLAKKMWCTIVPVAPSGGGKILTTAFHAFSSGLSRFFVR